MIAVVYGTTGELIKLAPVLLALRDRGAMPLTLCTGQQVEQIPTLLADLGLPEPDVWLAHGHRGQDLSRRPDLPGWLFGTVRRYVSHRRWLRARLAADAARPLLIIHGDTMTTVLGALMGRAIGVPVAHIEAGMRSGDWRNPFPEELDRLAAARLAQVHFAPGAHAAENLRAMRIRGEIIDTQGNTIRDALDLVPVREPGIALPQESFGLVSLHRSELLSNRRALGEILEVLRQASRRMPVLFIDHPVTVAAIEAHGLDALFDERFRHVPRQRYFQFIALLRASAFLVTDSGGSQQECAQLGHPCLVHRAVSEHPDGLGGSVVLSQMSIDAARGFLEDPLSYAGRGVEAAVSPTEIILEYLRRNGYLVTR